MISFRNLNYAYTIRFKRDVIYFLFDIYYFGNLRFLTHINLM